MTRRAAAFAVALALAGVEGDARADETPACPLPQDQAIPGHYTGQGSVSIRSTGDFDSVQIEPLQMTAPFEMTFDVGKGTPRRGTALSGGTFTITADLRLTAFSPGGASSHGRSEGGSAPLEGFASVDNHLNARGGGIDFALLVQRVTCSEIHGTVNSNRGTLQMLRTTYRSGGLSVEVPLARWSARLATADAGLEARVWTMRQQLRAVTDPLADASTALIRAAVAMARDISTDRLDPYRDCLASQLLEDAAVVARNRVSALLAMALTGPQDAPTLAALIRRIIRESRLTHFLGGCETLNDPAVNSALRLLVRRLGERLTKIGASANRLYTLLQVEVTLGSSEGIADSTERLNQLAVHAGHEPPFPPQP